MSFEGISNLKVGVPDFKFSIPSNRGEVRRELSFRVIFQDRGVSQRADPISVVVIFGGEFIISENVP